MSVTILTATLPERAEMLAEAKASVEAQTWRSYGDKRARHIVAVDDAREGAGAVLDDLLQVVDTPWVMVLDDDDLLDPGHLKTVMAYAERDDFDVIYTRPKVMGGEFTLYHRPFDARLLAKGVNCISHTALMRTSLIRQVGGWSNVRAFDLDLFRRLEQAGAEFLAVPQETWTYRLHGSNWSQGTLEGAMA